MPAAAHPDEPDRRPQRGWRLAAGDGHSLHVEEWGAADGLPALVLHGGPGSGCTPLLRRFFDPARYRIVCPDQRGAGRSLPAGGIHANTTAHLLADLRLLRSALGIERWLVVGGSWGATLALAHALDDPAAVAGLLLRATFLARPQDVAAFFADAPATLAQRWPCLAQEPPDSDQARDVVAAWAAHERRLSGSHAAAAPDTAALAPRYRIQSHYLQHGCWLQSPPLLERCAAIRPVPTLLLHGSEDRICAPEGALLLAARLPHATLRWAPGAGHDPAHPAMHGLMVEALDHFAAHRCFTSADPVASVDCR